MYKDYLVRATSGNNEIRAFAITTRNLVEEARIHHNSSPICTAALGRLMSAALMMGDMLKNEEDVLTIQIQGDGRMRGLAAVSNNKGEVRGYTRVKDVILPPNAQGHLNVGGAIGKGTLTVIRDFNMKEPYVSTIPLHNGEIAEDLTYYFAQSEQTASSVGLGVLMNKDNTVKQAGGFIVQLMPSCPEESIQILERNLRNITSVTSILDEGKTPEEMLGLVLKDLDPQILGTKEVKFKCNCSREKAEQILMMSTKKDLEELSKKEDGVEVVCEFCSSVYKFSQDEIKQMAKDALD